MLLEVVAGGPISAFRYLVINLLLLAPLLLILLRLLLLLSWLVLLSLVLGFLPGLVSLPWFLMMLKIAPISLHDVEWLSWIQYLSIQGEGKINFTSLVSQYILIEVWHQK